MKKLKAGDRVAVCEFNGKFLWSGTVADRPGSEWARVRSDISGEVRTVLVTRLRLIDEKLR